MNACKKRHRMPLKPSTSNGGRWHREEQRVERDLDSLGHEVHPGRQVSSYWPCIKQSPKKAQHEQCEHTHPKCLVKLSIKIPDRQIHALLRTAKAIGIGDQHQDRGSPMEKLGDPPITSG